jgi:hypothetical protein
MIPQEMLHTKPIDLRHVCLFYLGHVPAFLDIYLKRFAGLQDPSEEGRPADTQRQGREANSADPERAYFHKIFERGIDPDVDDPSQCHAHSEVPTDPKDWPSLSAILGFRDSVRKRVRTIYGLESKINRRLGRVLMMTYEHEGMHLETLLYMLLQRAGEPGGTLPPPGFAAPVWDDKSEVGKPAGSVTMGPASVVLGHDDLEADDTVGDDAWDTAHEFGWDNENPKREVAVGEFRIDWKPVSNGEFYDVWKAEEAKGSDALTFPASWIQVDGQVKVSNLIASRFISLC